MSCQYQITITADSRGDFTYTPSTVHVKRGDTVCWISGKGAFAVSFMDQTPFLGVSFSSIENERGEHVIEALKIRDNAIGHHHYAVAQVVPGPPKGAGGEPTIRVVLDSGCPDIVVSGDDN